MSDNVSYAEAVTELARLSGWAKSDVKGQPRDAAWVCYGRVAQWRAIVEAGDR